MESNRSFLDPVPSDILLIFVVVTITQALVHYGPAWAAPLRIVFGGASVLFAPGYVTLAAVTTRPELADSLSEWEWVGHELDRWECATLSVILSVVIVPILGIGASFTSFGIRPAVVTSLVGIYTICVGIIGAVHRARLTSERVTTRMSNTTLRQLLTPQTSVDGILNLLIVVIVLAGGLVVVAPQLGQSTAQFTEFYLLSENESGNISINESFSSAGPGETTVVIAGITNREQQPVQYTVISQIQRAEIREQQVAVREQRQVSNVTVDLKAGDRAQIPYELTTRSDHPGCRITFLLYRGPVPEEPTVDNAYRELHLWNDPYPPNRTRCSISEAVDVQTNRSAITVFGE